MPPELLRCPWQVPLYWALPTPWLPVPTLSLYWALVAPWLPVPTSGSTWLQPLSSVYQYVESDFPSCGEGGVVGCLVGCRTVKDGHVKVKDGHVKVKDGCGGESLLGAHLKPLIQTAWVTFMRFVARLTLAARPGSAHCCTSSAMT